jgi:cobalt/nickel transport system ATP-binding protein
MLAVEGVSYAYAGGPVLDSVTFTVERGEKIVLLGTNGCGKTTLLKCLNGLLYPSRGKILYNGDFVTRTSLKDRAFHARFRSEVVFLFQNPDAMLFNPTVYDEIAFGLRQLQQEDIGETVRRWSDLFGLTPKLDQPPFQLSNGEKQKVCLAALLALEPKLLLLDEPTANLDPRSTGWLIDLLGGLDTTAIVTTHNLSLASELGTRTLLLSEAHRLIYDGEIGALFEDTGKLMEANLVHRHSHTHGAVEHTHFHIHDWD